MKKLLSLFLSLLLLVGAAGCSEYKPVESGSGGSGESSSSSQTPVEGVEFSVTLSIGGTPFTQTDGMKAVWTNRYGVHEAAFENGEATIKGLDGDFTVTVEGLPNDLTYNPNVHKAGNDSPAVDIPLHEIIKTRGKGNDLYNTIITIDKSGVYRAEIEDEKDQVFYQFQPSENGEYVIESWVDTAVNQTNPILNAYYGTTAAKFFDKTIDDGGVESTYTKNFKNLMYMTEETAGHGVLPFSIKATNRMKEYPVYVDFWIGWLDEYNPERTEPTVKEAEHDFSKAFTWDKGIWRWAETTVNGATHFDGERYKYNDETGFYHLYNEETGFGKKLYVAVNLSLNQRPFADYEGSPISLYGLASGAAPTDPIKNVRGYNYKNFVATYAAHTNDYGVYPVTKEMKDFLQEFALSQRYFADGDGYFESAHGIYALEENQWLFACGYYQ